MMDTHKSHSSFSLASSNAAQWGEAVQDCLQQLSGSLHSATLGFLYATDYFANRMGDILAVLQEAQDFTWVGTTGYTVWANERVYQDEPALVMLTVDWPADSFAIVPALRVPDSIDLQQPLLVHGRMAGMALLHADPRNLFVAELLERLALQLPAADMAGGITSSRYMNAQVAGEVWHGGVSGVLLSESLPAALGVAQGAREFGAEHVVTACEENIVLTLDGRPALEVFREEVGELLWRNPEQIPGYIFAALDMPNGDYLVRDIVGLDMQQQLLAVGEYLTAGMHIHFCRRDGRAAWDDLRDMVQATRAGLGCPARAAIYIACVGRGEHVFGTRDAELQLLREELGEVPLIGFAAAGEIAHGRLYGYSGVLLLLG